MPAARHLQVDTAVKQLAFDFTTPAVPVLDNFVVGRNVELVQRLRKLAADKGGERFIYLWGAPGSGRTHLLQGAVASLREAGSKAALFEAALDLPYPTDIDIVAIDDVQRLSESGQRALFNLYNRLRECGGTLLAAGSAPPSELRLRPDIVTRLAWGLVYEVHSLSDAEKAEALAEHAVARGFTLQPDVARYLLTHLQRDMRTLNAMLDSLDRYSLESKRPVTVALARELISLREDGR